VFEQGGPAELQKYLAEMSDTSPARPGLFNSEGRNVLGQESTPVLMPLIFRASRTYETQFETDHETRVLAQRTYGPSGKSYVFYTEIAPLPFGPFHSGLRELLIRLAANCHCGDFSVPLVGALHHVARIAASACPCVKLRQANSAPRVGATLGRRRDEIAALGTISITWRSTSRP